VLASKSVDNDEWYVSHWSIKEDGIKFNTTITDCNNIHPSSSGSVQ